MSAHTLDALPWTLARHQIEDELLTQVRQAEAAFKQAPADQKEVAGERYREALQRFSELILDRRVPPAMRIPQ
ncbi:MAG: hypothetical protein LAP40_12950 [Acidobacteriia bacterium]|nr:hypothetical protein [Terriglobia bacterium]